MDHVFLSQIWLALDHFFIITDGLVPALTDITFHGLNYVPNPSSSQGNQVPWRRAGLHYREQYCNSNWRLLGNSQDSGDGQSQSHQMCEASKKVAL